MSTSHPNEPGGQPETIVRRNATILIYRDATPPVVEKSYQHLFDVQQESDAYKKLARVAADIPGIRTPIVHETSIADNRLTLEFISGLNLVQQFKRDGLQVLDAVRDQVIDLCVKAQAERLKFDLAPEHFMEDPVTRDWVVIDPVTEDHPIRHFSFVVFMIGLIKCFGSRLRPWNVLAHRKTWLGFYRQYAKKSNATPRELNSEFAQLINCVIGWNLQAYENETILIRVLRIIVLIPAWFLIRLPFRMQWIK
jgi:hypothetical protein